LLKCWEDAGKTRENHGKMWEKTREHDIMLENDGKVETCGKEVVFRGKKLGKKRKRHGK